MKSILITAMLMLAPLTAHAEPPYRGTIWAGFDIIRTDDTSAFDTLMSAGTGSREMFDRRSNSLVTRTAYLFIATFTDGLEIKIQVNPEFGSVEEAEKQALRHLPAVGQLPTLLRRDVETMTIHAGDNDYGGGNNDLLIHTGRTAQYIRAKNLEETLFHEAVHTSIDGRYADSPEWKAAQAADSDFISSYARDHPDREDMAESMLPAYGVLIHPNRISAMQRDTIRETMPNRLAFFEALLAE